MREFKAKDLSAVQEWLVKRGKFADFSRVSLPEIGFIEPDVAVGFLYRGEAQNCFLDVYISNPDAAKEARNSALDAITNELILRAKELGFKNINAITKDDSIVVRAQRHGMKLQSGVHFLSMEV